MRRASGPSTIPIPLEDIFLTVSKLQQVAPPNKGRATLHYTLPVSLLPSKLPLLLPRQDCKGRIRSCGGSIFNENATFTATTGLPHNPGILSRQKSQAIGYGPLEDNCLKIDKLQQAAPPNKGRAALRYTLSASQLPFRQWGLFAFDHSSFFVFEIAAEDDDPVNDDPDAKTAQGEKHGDGGAGFADVEPVYAKDAQEPAEQKAAAKRKKRAKSEDELI